MKKETAKQIHEIMIEFSGKLNDSLNLVMTTCKDEEFREYRSAVARILGEMLLGVMNPIYAEFPDIRPRELENFGSKSEMRTLSGRKIKARKK